MASTLQADSLNQPEDTRNKIVIWNKSTQNYVEGALGMSLSIHSFPLQAVGASAALACSTTSYSSSLVENTLARADAGELDQAEAEVADHVDGEPGVVAPRPHRRVLLLQLAVRELCLVRR